jgi:hypothetical protein
LYEGNFVQSKAVLRVLRGTAFVVLEDGNHANNALFSPPTFRHGMIFGNRCVPSALVERNRNIFGSKMRLLSTDDLRNASFAEIEVLFY